MTHLLPPLSGNTQSTVTCLFLGVAFVVGYHRIIDSPTTRRWKTALAQQKWTALWVLVALQFADLTSTYLALSVPGVFEMNPIVRALGFLPAKLLTAAFAAALIWHVRSLGRVWAVCGIYCLIVVSNVRLAVL